jgi:hypothetical protein
MRNYIAMVFKNESKAHEGLRELWDLDARTDITLHGTKTVHRDWLGHFHVEDPPGAHGSCKSGCGQDKRATARGPLKRSNSGQMLPKASRAPAPFCIDLERFTGRALAAWLSFSMSHSHTSPIGTRYASSIAIGLGPSRVCSTCVDFGKRSCRATIRNVHWMIKP